MTGRGARGWTSPASPRAPRRQPPTTDPPGNLTWPQYLLTCWIGLTAVLGIVGLSTASQPDPDRAQVLAAAVAPPEPGPAAPAVAVGTPLRVIAPAIGLDVPLVPTGLTADRALAVPPFGTAGWFDLGPRPGEGGPAVLAGHVDSRRGPDVFYDLRRLLPGDEIHVLSDDGDTRTFTVEAVEQTPKDELPVDRIWDGSTAPVLRLITCGGTFDETQRTYRSNVIVYARATGTALAA